MSGGYAWIGPPTQFNGTNSLTGGDSCALKPTILFCPGLRTILHDMIGIMNQKIKTNPMYSRRKFESMVLFWGSSVYHRGLGHGSGHDTRTGLFVFGPCSEEISLKLGLCLHGLLFGHHFSMVLLGIFIGLLRPSKKRVYRRSQSFRTHQYSWCAEPWISPDP